jgi:hypothetical protein
VRACVQGRSQSLCTGDGGGEWERQRGGMGCPGDLVVCGAARAGAAVWAGAAGGPPPHHPPADSEAARRRELPPLPAAGADSALLRQSCQIIPGPPPPMPVHEHASSAKVRT